MNNLKQKNVILGLHPSTELPYSDVKYVNLYADCDIITNNELNNAARQLLDNDLYIEQYLNNVSSYVYGPKTADDLDNRPNGYKIYGEIDTAESLEILRKKEQPLSSTIERINQKTAVFVTKFGNTTFIGYNGQPVEYSKQPLDNDWRQLDIVANAYYQDDDRLIFAATDGVYQLSSSMQWSQEEKRQTEAYETVRLNKDPVKNIRSVYLDTGKETLNVGDGANIKAAAYDMMKDLSELRENLDFIDQELIISENASTVDSIRAFGSDGTRVIAGGAQGVYLPQTQTGYINFKQTQKSGVADYTKVIQLGKMIYVGTSDGLYIYDNDTLVKFDNDDIDPVIDIKSDGSKLYVACKHSVYTVDRNKNKSDNILDRAMPSNRIPASAEIISIELNDNNIFIGTTDGLYYFELSDIIYVNEIYSNGQSAPLSADATKRIKNITTVRLLYNVLYIGTSTGLLRFDLASSQRRNTVVIERLNAHTDEYGQKTDEPVIKIIMTNSERVYIATSSRVFSVNDIMHGWRPANEGEAVTDVCAGTIDGTEYIIVSTTVNVYFLSDEDKPQLKLFFGRDAETEVRLPADSVTSVGNIIVVKHGEQMSYVYKSHNNILTGISKVFESSAADFNKILAYDGRIYLIDGSDKVRQYSFVTQPVKSNYAPEEPPSQTNNFSALGFSKARNGYFFVKNRKLVFKYAECNSEDGDLEEIEITVKPEVVCYDTADIICLYIDDKNNTAYIGTDSGLYKADISEKLPQTVDFQSIAGFESKTVQKILSITRGYDYSEDPDQNYWYEDYDIRINPETGDEIPATDNVSRFAYKTVHANGPEFIFVSTQKGLYKFQISGGSPVKVSETVFSSVTCTENAFICVTARKDDLPAKLYVHRYLYEQSVDESKQLYRGVEVIKNTLKSESAVVVDNFKSIELGTSDYDFCSASEEFNNIIITVSGPGRAVRNKVSITALSDFKPTDFPVDIAKAVYSVTDNRMNVLVPDNEWRKAVFEGGLTTEETNEDKYVYDSSAGEWILDTDSEGEVAQATVVNAVPYEYQLLSYIAENMRGDYLILASDGMYKPDQTNMAASYGFISDSDGNEITNAKDICVGYGDKFIIACGAGTGIQSLDGSVVNTRVVADKIALLGRNYLMKIVSGHHWRYCENDKLPELTKIQDATELDSILESAGIGETADFRVCAERDMIAVADEDSIGECSVFDTAYFTNIQREFSVYSLPSAIQNNCAIVSVNDEVVKDNIRVICRGQSGTVKLYRYTKSNNSAALQRYMLNGGAVNEFQSAFYLDCYAGNTMYCVYAGQMYEITGGSTLSQCRMIQDVNNASKIGSLTYFATKDSIVRFESSGEVTVWVLVYRIGQINKILGMPGKCLIAASDGFYVYNDDMCAQIKYISSGVDSLIRYTEGTQTGYICSILDETFSVTNYKLWKSLLKWDRTSSGQSTGVGKIVDQYRINQNTYIAATDKGLYITRYAYTMENDTKPFTKEDALTLYNHLFSSDISVNVSVMMSNHISGEDGLHLSSSTITRINNDYLNTQLNNITDWQSATLDNQTDGFIDIHNDIIHEMHFGDYTDGDVAVKISSYLTDNEYVTLTDIQYIMKRWMSGITEIYISIPSISSYYLANTYGASNCTRPQAESYSRKNLEQFGVNKKDQDSTLSTHFTSFQVGIAQTSYRINNILDIQVNGNSLPLGIYRDQTETGDTDFPGMLYRSFIQPSVVKNYDIAKTDDDGYYLFDFAAFGTDAQAVKLMFYDEKSRTGSPTVEIVFNANGGEGVMPKQKFIIAYDTSGKTVLEQQNLRKNTFTNTSSGYNKLFAGWSIQPLAENQPATYADRDVFPKSTTFQELMAELGNEHRTTPLRKNEQFTLYAVWYSYNFSDKDTTVEMESNKTEFYIDSVGVNPQTSLKDSVVINWGD